MIAIFRLIVATSALIAYIGKKLCRDSRKRLLFAVEVGMPANQPEKTSLSDVYNLYCGLW